MKVYSSIFLIFSSIAIFSQQSNSISLAELKQQILISKEVVDWQNTMIAFQKSNLDFCALKYQQKLNTTLFTTYRKNSPTASYKDFTLKLFRTMRITNELKDSTIVKENLMRLKFPQLVTHFKFDEIFPDIYAPIQKAREEYLKINFQ